MRVPDYIASIKAYVPGKPIEELEREYGLKGIVKLASNENPLGSSPLALAAIKEALLNLHRYPDGSSYYLVKALSEELGLKAESIVLGNGSDDILAMLVKAFLSPGDKALMPYPSFLMYEILVKASGAIPEFLPLKDMEIDLDAMLSAIDEKTRLIFITNPNNPTGCFIPREKLLAFLDKLPDSLLLILDEAYIEFVDKDLSYSGLDYLSSYPNLVVLRTFSKAYGLAGIRLGYGLMSEQIADYLHRVRQPFNVNALAQAGALAALKDKDFLERSYKLNIEGKAWFKRELEALGLKVYPSEANFFLLELEREGKSVFEDMLKHGVIVRSMHGYGFPDCIRISVGLKEENESCLRALKLVLNL